MSNPSVGDSTNLLLKKLVESTQNIIGGGAVSSVNGQVGIVDLTASDVGYAPAVSANWTGADPTTIQGALDRIAAAIGPIA